MNSWSKEATFYHIYPLGFCGAPFRNDFSAPQPRLEKIFAWLDHIQWLGANAIYLGPVFESSTHGYDTIDYYRVDRRLGDNSLLASLSEEIHRRGMRLVLDGVFNHCGRDFWAFQDVLTNGRESAFKEWFHNLSFDAKSPLGDPFTYESWNKHYELVKFNLAHPEVKAHLFHAILQWVQEFEIDGLRLDAADHLSHEFIGELSQFTGRIKDDFWLMGEVVFGDYTRWAGTDKLNSVTNYEVYKGLYSSLNDQNFFEIAYSLNRQSGAHGIYRQIPLYNFADNHDVDRVASMVKDKRYLFPLYFLMFTMPGIPSVYYGSEWGLEGVKSNHSDQPLRPELSLDHMIHHAPQPDLPEKVQTLIKLRKSCPVLNDGDYRQLEVNHQSLVFERKSNSGHAVVAINGSEHPQSIKTPAGAEIWHDVLTGEKFDHMNANITLPPFWGRVLKAE